MIRLGAALSPREFNYYYLHLSTTQNKPAGYDINLFKITITFKIRTNNKSG